MAFITVASLVLAAIGTSVSAYSAVAAGQNAKETADYNAEMQRRQAKDTLVRGSIAADEKRQQARKIIGAQTAAMGASGFATDSGSPLQLLTESAGFGELDALRALNNAQRQASGLNAQADITQWQGNVPGLVEGALLESVKRYGIGKVFHGIESQAWTPLKKSLAMAGTMGAQTAAEGGSLKDIVVSTITGLALMPPGANTRGEAIRAELTKQGVAPEISREIAAHVDGLESGGKVELTPDPASDPVKNAENIKRVIKVANSSRLKRRSPEDFKDFTREAAADAPPVTMPVEKFDELLQAADKTPEEVLDHPEDYYTAKMEESPTVEIPMSDVAAMAEHVTPDAISEMGVDGAPSLAETERRSKETDASAESTPATIEPSALAAFPEMSETEGGGYAINQFAPHEQDSLRKAGAVYTNPDGYEVVDPDKLWKARKELQKLPVAEQNRLVEESKSKMFAPETRPESENQAGQAQRTEPWQMTRDEYVKNFRYETRPGKFEGAWRSEDKARIGSVHKSEVQAAISEGKSVPAQVLAEYPDLFKSRAEEFIDREATKDKSHYNLIDPAERGKALESAISFINKYAIHDRTNPMVSKFGHQVIFEPDPRGDGRIPDIDRMVEYALHSTVKDVTGDTPPGQVRIGKKIFDASKNRNLDMIGDIIRNADGWGVNKKTGKVWYYKEVRADGQPYGAIILEMEKIKGSDLAFRFTTFLPDRNKSFLKDLERPTEARPAGPADTTNAGSDGISIDKSIPPVEVNVNPVKSEETTPPEPGTPAKEVKIGGVTLDSEELTGIKDAMTDAEREASGDTPTEKISVSDKSRQEEGRRRVDSGEYDPVKEAQKIVDNPGVMVTAEEEASLIYGKKLLEQADRKVRAALDEARAAGDEAKTSELEAQHAKNRTDYATIQQASEYAGTPASAALRMRRYVMDENYDFLNIVAQMESQNEGQPLPAETIQRIKDLTDKLTEAEAKIKEYEEGTAKKMAETTINKIKREVSAEGRKSRRAATKQTLDAEFVSLKDQLNKVLGRVSANPMFNPEVYKILTEMAKNRIKNGVVEVDSIVDFIHEQIVDVIEGVTKRDIRDAISGYGKKMSMSQDALSVALREAKRQMKLISALEDATGGKPPERSGLQRDPVSNDVRELQKQVKQAMRDSGIDQNATISPEQQWKTSLDSIKTRLKNQIHDLTKQLETGEKSPKKKGVAYDEEASILRQHRDSLKKTLERIEGKPEMSDEQRVKVATAAVEKSITELERRIKERDTSTAVKARKTPETPELKKLREQRDKLRESYDEQKQLFEDMKKESKADTDPLEAQRQKFMAETEHKVKATEKALQKSVDEYQRRISENDLDPAKKISSTPETPETAKLKAERDRLKEVYKQMQDDAKPPKDPEAGRLKALKTRLAKRIAEMEQQLATGDFSKAPKRAAVEVDTEAATLKDNVGRLKLEIDRIKEQQRLEDRSRFEKGFDAFNKWRRAIILSSVKTVGKLSAAAAFRQIVTPVEELFGTGLAKIPGIKDISAKAPREGAGSIQAEAAAFAQWFNRQSYIDAWNVMTTGQSSLDIAHGKPHLTNPTMIEFFGQMHAALKLIPKRAEFSRSLEKRSQHAIEQGRDITQPAVQAELAAASYVDASRAIFMNDNMITDAWKMALHSFRQHGEGGKAVANTMQALMPIVKVPTNFAIEVQQLSSGGLNALAKIIQKGAKNLTPEESDYVMRAIKKQSIGAMFLILGYSMSESIGGYYQEGQRRTDDTKPGDVIIAGVSVPHFLLHTPVLEMLQVGATLRRVQEAYRMKGEGPATSAGAGAFKAAVGVASHIPMLEEPVRLSEAMKSSEGASKFLSEFAASLVIPPDAGNLAKALDGDTPRKPTNFIETFENKIPGLRQNVPENHSAIEREILGKFRRGDELNDYQRTVYENLPETKRQKLQEDAAITPRQLAFKNMSDPTLEKSIKVWSRATDSEREQLRDIYEHKINMYFMKHHLDPEEVDQLNAKIARAEERK